MHGEDHTPLLHHLRELAVGLDHDDGVAGLQRHHDLVEIGLDTHLKPFHRRLGHGEGRVSVEIGDIVPERAVVQADADGGAVLLADGEETGELAAGLLMVLVEIAGVDADLLHDGRDGNGRLRREVNVGHEGRLYALCAQPAADFGDVRHVLEARHGDADQLRAGCGHATALGDRPFNVGSMGVAHRLRDDGEVGTDADAAADGNGQGFHLTGRVLFPG